jgi:hypothetical protein
MNEFRQYKRSVRSLDNSMGKQTDSGLIALTVAVRHRTGALPGRRAGGRTFPGKILQNLTNVVVLLNILRFGRSSGLFA